MTAPITEAGLYDGIPDDVYHAGQNTPTPSLSQSQLKLLMPPSTPAHFAWRLTHPEGTKRAFDVGRAAHTTVLGVGEPMAACPDDLLASNGTMTTKVSKEWALEQRRHGIVPLTPADFRLVMDMAEALAEHPQAAELLTDPTNRPEVSAYAQHEATGVWLRGRFDLLGGELFDYKTARSADPEQFRRSAVSYGYHVQDVFYRRLAYLTTGAVLGPLTFIVQEKTPPYLPSLVQLDTAFEQLAQRQLDTAFALFAECTSTDTWPGYSADVVTVSPPSWALSQAEASEAADVLDELERYLSE